MHVSNLKEHLVNRVLLRVQMPAQYIGGELNMERKAPRHVRGRLCLAFPDAYTIGMSHHGLQVLYSLMNARDDWYCERVFTPWPDMEDQLRQAGLPLYSLETFTPLADFDGTAGGPIQEPNLDDVTQPQPGNNILGLPGHILPSRSYSLHQRAVFVGETDHQRVGSFF